MSRVHQRRLHTLVVLFVAAVVGVAALLGNDAGDGVASGSPAPAATPEDSAPASTDADATSGEPTAGDTTPPTGGESTGDAATPTGDTASTDTSDDCLMSEFSLRQGQSGDSVVCLQEALVEAGFLDGSDVSGTFDGATFAAVEAAQTDRSLFVDGVVGRETAISLGIWPDEESFVVRTPPPPPGAVDSMGYRLSSVSSTGADAPPLPANSGSGRRVVYERAGQRVWAVDDDGSIIRSWLVSGSKYSNETPGVHQVYSRSERSTAWNGKAWLPLMVRYLKTRIGAIGFHAIPLHVEDNSPYQTEAELGTRLSGGCQRQANADAEFLWNFAQVGTTVVVI